jgi:hypothetical protein
MFVESVLQAARERLVTIVDDAELVEAARLLTSGTDLVIVCDSEGLLQNVVSAAGRIRKGYWLPMIDGRAAGALPLGANVFCDHRSLVEQLADRGC